MPKWLSNIFGVLSISIIIGIGTIVYKTGSKDTSVSYQIKDLSGLTVAIKLGFDSISFQQENVINAVKDLQSATTKMETKLNTIVNNLPNNDELIRQLYEIELGIKRKNDTIDLLTQQNTILRERAKYKIGTKKVEEDKW